MNNSRNFSLSWTETLYSLNNNSPSPFPWAPGNSYATFFFLKSVYFYLEDNCFTMPCWFLAYISMNQVWIYPCALPLEPPYHLPPHPTPPGFHFSVQFSHWVVSDSLRPHGLQHTRFPCPSPNPRVYSNSCPLSWWCHPTILPSVTPFSSCLQSFPASGSFPMSRFFTSGGQSIGVSASASVLPMNIQDWFLLGLTSLISLQSKGLSRVFSSTTVQKHELLTMLSFLYSPTLTSIHDC